MDNIKAIIEKIGILRSYAKGELLFSAEDKATGLYYVQSGEIRVYKMDDQGHEVEVVRLGPGDYLGEAIVFVSNVFPVFAQAVNDSKVIFISKTSLFQNIEREPGMANFFISLLARKCVILNKRIEVLGLTTVRQRLIQYLLSQCGSENKCVIELKIKKFELARILGTISETLSRNLKQLQEEGLIRVSKSRIQVVDRSKLQSELF